MLSGNVFPPSLLGGWKATSHIWDSAVISRAYLESRARDLACMSQCILVCPPPNLSMLLTSSFLTGLESITSPSQVLRRPPDMLYPSALHYRLETAALPWYACSLLAWLLQTSRSSSQVQGRWLDYWIYNQVKATTSERLNKRHQHSQDSSMHNKTSEENLLAYVVGRMMMKPTNYLGIWSFENMICVAGSEKILVLAAQTVWSLG